MCLTLPGKIIKLNGQKAKIVQSDHTHWVDISAVGKVKIGDYVVTYQGFAIDKVSFSEAQKTIKLLKQL